MAIYSLRLSPIGKTTQKRPYTAAAHIRYITRKTALSHAMAERMPEGSAAAIRWLRKEEDADRKNARVADKLVIALPRELNAEQRLHLVWRFSEQLTQGRASWFAAIHARGKDKDNPHCHLLVRDRDIETSQRVVMFSAGAKEIKERKKKGLPPVTSLPMIRQLWAELANGALEEAGRCERIDHRSLKEQGIDRPPSIHEGPNSRAMHARGFKPQSKDRIIRSRAYRRRGTPATRLLRYGEIDQGLTRVEYNEALKYLIATSDRPQDGLTFGARLAATTAWQPHDAGGQSCDPSWAEALSEELGVSLAEPQSQDDGGRER